MGLVLATSPGYQFPSCALPILVKKCSRRDQNLVPTTSPTNSKLFEFVGPVPGTSPTNYAWSLGVYCSWDKSLGPNENVSSDRLLFFPVDLVCVGSLDRTVVFLRFCTSNIGHWRKKLYRNCDDKH